MLGHTTDQSTQKLVDAEKNFIEVSIFKPKILLFLQITYEFCKQTFLIPHDFFLDKALKSKFFKLKMNQLCDNQNIFAWELFDFWKHGKIKTAFTLYAVITGSVYKI